MLYDNSRCFCVINAYYVACAGESVQQAFKCIKKAFKNRSEGVQRAFKMPFSFRMFYVYLFGKLPIGHWILLVPIFVTRVS